MGEAFNMYMSNLTKFRHLIMPDELILRYLDLLDVDNVEEALDPDIAFFFSKKLDNMLKDESTRNQLRFLVETRINILSEYESNGEEKVIVNLDTVEKYNHCFMQFEAYRKLVGDESIVDQYKLNDPKNRVYKAIRQDLLP